MHPEIVELDFVISQRLPQSKLNRSFYTQHGARVSPANIIKRTFLESCTVLSIKYVVRIILFADSELDKVHVHVL